MRNAIWLSLCGLFVSACATEATAPPADSPDYVVPAPLAYGSPGPAPVAPTWAPANDATAPADLYGDPYADPYAGHAAPRPAAPQPAAAPSTGSPFTRWDEPLAQVLADAQRTGRPALLLFTASWCGYCQKLDDETLPDPGVQAAAGRFVFVRYDADRGVGQTLATKYGIQGFPALVLLDASGNERDRWSGFNEPELYAAILRNLAESGKATG